MAFALLVVVAIPDGEELTIAGQQDALHIVGFAASAELGPLAVFGDLADGARKIVALLLAVAA